MKIKGFTVIEVLVVIGIIGILTVIIFPSINNIRAKNRDAEKVADISAIQLGLSLYKNQQNGVYPNSLFDLYEKKYISADTLATPDGGEYTYVPLTRDDGPDPKCTYYHLGVQLELPSGQIDTADNFNSTLAENTPKTVSGNYSYCGGYTGDGLLPPDMLNGVYNYNVRP